MIKYVLFDFDGTIADSRSAFLKIFNLLAKQNGFKEINNDEVQYLRTLTILQRCKYLNLPVYKIPFLASQLYNIYGRFIGEIPLYEGIPEVFDRLNSFGIKNIIVSSNSTNNINKILGLNNINQIDKIFTSNKIFGKDAMIKKLMSQQKASFTELIYVGDELRDIEASHKCNISCIWASWGYDVEDIFIKTKPDYIANYPSDVVEIVNKINSLK